MHLLGSKIGSYAITPTNDTIRFVNIPHWDFEWQEFLFFEKIKKLPKNSTIYGYGTYDNTSKNTHNPNNPPVLVRPGLNTTDEMFLIYFHYLPYQAGDEDRDIEALTSLGIGDYNSLNVAVYPNPSSDIINFRLPEESYGSMQLRIFDVNGQMVYEHKPTTQSTNELSWDIPEGIEAGVYFYSMNVDGTLASGSFMIQR